MNGGGSLGDGVVSCQNLVQLQLAPILITRKFKQIVTTKHNTNQNSLVGENDGYDRHQPTVVVATVEDEGGKTCCGGAVSCYDVVMSGR